MLHPLSKLLCVVVLPSLYIVVLHPSSTTPLHNPGLVYKVLPS